MDNTKSYQYFDCLSVCVRVGQCQRANWIKINWRQICFNNKTNVATRKPLVFKQENLWLIMPNQKGGQTFSIYEKLSPKGKFPFQLQWKLSNYKTQTELGLCFTCRKCNGERRQLWLHVRQVSHFPSPCPTSADTTSLDSGHVHAALRWRLDTLEKSA